jgi:hypothetical protein
MQAEARTTGAVVISICRCIHYLGQGANLDNLTTEFKPRGASGQLPPSGDLLHLPNADQVSSSQTRFASELDGIKRERGLS